MGLESWKSERTQEAQLAMHRLDCAILTRISQDEKKLANTPAPTSCPEVTSTWRCPASVMARLNLPPAQPINGDICSICYDDFDEPVPSLCGKHSFCQKCLGTWLDRKPSCPTCRHSLGDLLPKFTAWAKEDMYVFRNSLGDAPGCDNRTAALANDYASGVLEVWVESFIRGFKGRMSKVPGYTGQHWASGIVYTYVMNYQMKQRREEILADRIEQLTEKWTRGELMYW